MSVRRYAEGTTVDVAKSKSDIERLVTLHGANGFVSGYDYDSAIPRSILIFRLRNRTLKYTVDKPAPEKFKSYKRNRKPERLSKIAEQEHMRRWRSLFLIIKAKLEIIESAEDQATAFDKEFMADIMLPGGETLGDKLLPQLAAAYESGNMQLPQLLPGN